METAPAGIREAEAWKRETVIIIGLTRSSFRSKQNFAQPRSWRANSLLAHDNPAEFVAVLAIAVW